MELLPINNDVIKLFGIVRYQIGENGAPKIEAISSVLDIYEVENKRVFFESIMICFNVAFTVENEKDKKENDD